VMMTDDEVVVVVKGKSKSHFGKVGDSGRHRVVHCGTVQSYPTILPSDISMYIIIILLCFNYACTFVYSSILIHLILLKTYSVKKKWIRKTNFQCAE